MDNLDNNICYRCKVEEDSRKTTTGRELRRSRTASRILPAEFTVEEPRTFTSEEDETEGSRKVEVSLGQGLGCLIVSIF